jgi:hypothetical protein
MGQSDAVFEGLEVCQFGSFMPSGARRQGQKKRRISGA